MTALAGYTGSPNGTDSRWPEMEQWITCAARRGAQDFWHLVDMLPGAFPTDVRQTLDGLVARSVVPEHLTIESATRRRDCGTELEVPNLPAPHPLAFDWRFTKATAAGLLEEATTLSPPDGLIGLLGAPSVYFLARKHGNGDRVTLLDQNPLLVECLPEIDSGGSFHRCDIGRESSVSDLFSVIIADPPWYLEDALAFLRTSSRLCADRGTVLLSYAPDGSKPDIARQREKLIAGAADMGLQLEITAPLALSYVTPLFEHNALLASGFKHVPRDWRRGDLLHFKKVSNCRLDRSDSPVHLNIWSQFDVNGVGIWVRDKEGGEFADPCLEPVVPGDVLPTVSRSDPRRQVADVWTSGNRIYRCKGSNILNGIIGAVAVNQDPFQAVNQIMNRPPCGLEVNFLRIATRQIEHLVELERRELRSLRNAGS